ncbi:hypothetical protein J3459_007747 [Metarhizium acridum]|uniref:uncharacterized protein n=1 Tax=Metarhizium acridum TaxID=92637 RepID=UPI001C6BFB9A|nr:hypothetical protein J3458_019070 [Metarhizium acridum]KAG8426860.1 hypothetical protein J3459_007747 [Metarhizium acridum]
MSRNDIGPRNTGYARGIITLQCHSRLEKSINNGGCSMPVWKLADTVLHHMLQALDHLATKGIVHRDMKPANILYITGKDGKYHFQLGDFGFCNQAIMAQSQVGTPIYMAPEMFKEGEQTHKLDIWSLYVTILWTLDIGGFRE